MSEISKEQFARGTVWKLLERFVGRGISLIISVILARLLTPDDYGLIALTTVFTNLSEILIDAGFGTALVRKEEVDEDDYACVFVISFVISAFLYVILFFVAPFIAQYYEKRELTAVLRVMSLVLFVQAFASARNAYFNRNMQFRVLMECNTAAAVLSGVTGIVLACCAFGVWALVLQRLLQQVFITVFLFIRVRWKPKFRFHMGKFRELFSFSTGVIGASLVNYVENCVNSLIIGKHYSVADLGYCDKATILPEQISLNSFGAMTNVLLPTVSSYQSDIEKLNRVIRKVVSYTSFVLFPVMLGMLMVSREAIVVFFTEKWLPSVPLMQCMCIYYIATPLMLIDIQVFFGLGHSKIRLKTELYRMLFLLTGLIVCCFLFKLDIEYLTLTNAIAVSMGTLVTHMEVKKLIGYTLTDRFRDTCKSMTAALAMCAMLYAAVSLPYFAALPALIRLIFEIVAGAGIYVLLSFLLKNDVFMEFVQMMKKTGGKKHG